MNDEYYPVTKELVKYLQTKAEYKACIWPYFIGGQVIQIEIKNPFFDETKGEIARMEALKRLFPHWGEKPEKRWWQIWK